MDPVSFTAGIIGLSGIFSVCLDIIDKVDSYKDYDIDTDMINTKFMTDKHLFTKWAREVGISKHKPVEVYSKQLDDPETQLIVQKILKSIQDIFSATDSTVSKLHSVVEAGPTSFPDEIRFPHTSQKTHKPRENLSKRNRIGWSLWRKGKFISQVEAFGGLVQRLYILVPPDGSRAGSETYKGVISGDPSLTNDNNMLFYDPQYSDLMKKMKEQIDREIKKELEIWLAAFWINDIYDRSIETMTDGTCEWILSRNVFREWMSTDFPSETAKILWINGPAGHGKTVLCAKVIQHLSQIAQSQVAHYFCSAASAEQRDPSNIIKSWVFQIISANRGAFDLACEKWEAQGGRNASLTDVIDLFQAIVRHIPNCTFVVDGLDECDWKDNPTGFFVSIKQATANTNTRILILSRNESQIQYGFRAISNDNNNQGLYEYQIRPDDVRSDNMLFSQSIVDNRLKNKSDIQRTELSQRIADRCEGVFLWVKILDGELSRGVGKNQKQLKKIIDETPTELYRLYERNWTNIFDVRRETERIRAFSILRWAAFTSRPLTILEITEALLIADDDSEDLCDDDIPDAIDDDYVSSEIIGLCGSFLEIREIEAEQELGSKTINLVHFSVKQFLLWNMPAQDGRRIIANERLRISNELSQPNILAKLCLRYLNFRSIWQESPQFTCGLNKRPFRDYAAGSWYQHIQKSGPNYNEVIPLANTLFSGNNENWKSWKAWFEAHDDKSNFPESLQKMTSSSPLFYASFLGLRDIVIHLLEETKLGVNDVDEFNGTALQAAAFKGQNEIVTMLLEKGADPNIANQEGWTPLNLASYRGHVEIIKLLLEKGADLTIATRRGWTPLNFASDQGHLEIVKLLLEMGADIMITDIDGWTPLNSAAIDGYLEIVKLLLDKDADITIANINGHTPLTSATSNGHLEIVKLLLDKGADITVADNHGWTPLNSAASNGYLEIVKLLLNKGADITVADNNGWTPLNLAVYNRYLEIVKLLLNKNADMTTANKRGNTPLNSAAINGYLEIAKLLLDRGADITIANNDGWTPLNLAAFNGHLEIVKLLLNKNADMTIANKHGNTPLIVAAINGHLEIVQLLLDNGADINFAAQETWTALEHALLNGKPDMAKLLFENRGDIKYENETLSDLAFKYGHPEIVKLLAEEEAKRIPSQN